MPAKTVEAEQPINGKQLAIEPELTPEDRALQIMRKPFEAHQISKMCKATKKDNQPGRCKDCGGWHKLPSVQLSYVGHAALTDRLLEADPRWTWEPLALSPDGTPMLDGDGGMWIKLTVAGVTRLGYGDAQGKSGGDATKERIGDALRNAAMRFGAALELWHKGDLHLSEGTKDAETEENETTNGELAEKIEWIKNAKDLVELKKLYTTVYNMFPSNPAAQKAIIMAKDERKQELS
jgi:hypothetical protein